MRFHTEDLPQFGVILIPPTSPEFVPLLESIAHRLATPIPGSPPFPFPYSIDPDLPTAILVNRSETAIAALSWVWKFEPTQGPPHFWRRTIAPSSSILAPFGLDSARLKLMRYWQAILPGSARAIQGLELIGDNTDVRSPDADEIWKGGGVGSSGRSRGAPSSLEGLTLTLDGVFFEDGAFAGPNTLHCFETVTEDVHARLEVGRIAREGVNRGLSSAVIFAEIERLTGAFSAGSPPRPHHHETDHPKAALQHLARLFRNIRRDDPQALDAIAAWANTPLPNFRRL